MIAPLVIAFSDKSLRLLCEDEISSQRALGVIAAKKLRRRLADLRAVRKVTDLVVGSPREIDGAHPRAMVVDIDDGVRLVFVANHRVNPVLQSGGVDWENVSRIKILRIENDNE